MVFSKRYTLPRSKLIDLLNISGDQKYVYDSVILEMGDVEYQTVEGEADTNTIVTWVIILKIKNLIANIITTL